MDTTRVTQTVALGPEFCLSARDLAGLPFNVAVNPMYRSAAPTKLFLVHLLLSTALKKYGSMAGIEVAAVKRVEKATRSRKTRCITKARRQEQLEAALDLWGVTFRERNFLCIQFIKHGVVGDWTMENVVRRMSPIVHDLNDLIPRDIFHNKSRAMRRHAESYTNVRYAVVSRN